MSTLTPRRPVTYCASDILSPDRPPEAAEYAKERCRLMVARELAATLADGNYYTIRLVESEEPRESHDFAGRYPDHPSAVRFTVRAQIRRVETLHVRMMAPPDPLTSMSVPALTMTAAGELISRVRRGLTRLWTRSP